MTAFDPSDSVIIDGKKPQAAYKADLFQQIDELQMELGELQAEKMMLSVIVVLMFVVILCITFISNTVDASTAIEAEAATITTKSELKAAGQPLPQIIKPFSEKRKPR